MAKERVTFKDAHCEGASFLVSCSWGHTPPSELQARCSKCEQAFIFYLDPRTNEYRIFDFDSEEYDYNSMAELPDLQRCVIPVFSGQEKWIIGGIGTVTFLKPGQYLVEWRGEEVMISKV